MRTLRFDKSTLTKFYNIYFIDLWKELQCPNPPMGGMIGILEPGSRSVAHMHHEGEIFIILGGRGKLHINNQDPSPIETGSMHYSKPFTDHWLENDGQEDLIFVGIWWEPRDKLTEAAEEHLTENNPLPRKVLISVTPPTPNGDLHLGHLSGPFLAGDVLRRYFIARDVPVRYITGSDDHQSYVPLKAYRDKSTPEEVARSFGDLIDDTYRRARIEFDYTLRPAEEADYKDYIRAQFRRLYESGKLIEKETEALFCSQTGKYHFEAHVSGGCPNCGQGSDGSACEQCGFPNQCVDLVGYKSKYEGTTLVKRKVKRLYLPLEPYRAKLCSFWDRMPMKPHLKALCRNLLEKGLPDIAMSHPADWGISSDIPGYRDHIYYVWAEMAFGFLYMAEKLDGFWKADGGELLKDGNRFYQCFGFDNGNFYVALFPALWAALEKPIHFPDQFITNEFLCLEGQKFSTSRAHAIWGNPFLKEVDADLTRFYLAYCSPESYQTNFQLEQFRKVTRECWQDTFLDWAENLAKRIETKFPKKLPDSGAWTSQQVQFLARIGDFLRRAETHMQPGSFSLFSSANNIFHFLKEARNFSREENFLFTTDSLFNESRTSVQLQLHALSAVAVALSPLMPDFAKTLWKSLGGQGQPRWAPLEKGFLATTTFNTGFIEALRSKLATVDRYPAEPGKSVPRRTVLEPATAL